MKLPIFLLLALQVIHVSAELKFKVANIDTNKDVAKARLKLGPETLQTGSSIRWWYGRTYNVQAKALSDDTMKIMYTSEVLPDWFLGCQKHCNKQYGNNCKGIRFSKDGKCIAMREMCDAPEGECDTKWCAWTRNRETDEYTALTTDCGDARRIDDDSQKRPSMRKNDYTRTLHIVTAKQDGTKISEFEFSDEEILPEMRPMAMWAHGPEDGELAGHTVVLVWAATCVEPNLMCMCTNDKTCTTESRYGYMHDGRKGQGRCKTWGPDDNDYFSGEGWDCSPTHGSAGVWMAAPNGGVRVGKTFLIRFKPDGTLDESFTTKPDSETYRPPNVNWFTYDSAEQDDAHLIGRKKKNGEFEYAIFHRISTGQETNHHWACRGTILSQDGEKTNEAAAGCVHCNGLDLTLQDKSNKFAFSCSADLAPNIGFNINQKHVMGEGQFGKSNVHRTNFAATAPCGETEICAIVRHTTVPVGASGQNVWWVRYDMETNKVTAGPKQLYDRVRGPNKEMRLMPFHGHFLLGWVEGSLWYSDKFVQEIDYDGNLLGEAREVAKFAPFDRQNWFRYSNGDVGWVNGFNIRWKKEGTQEERRETLGEAPFNSYRPEPIIRVARVSNPSSKDDCKAIWGAYSSCNDQCMRTRFFMVEEPAGAGGTCLLDDMAIQYYDCTKHAIPVYGGLATAFHNHNEHYARNAFDGNINTKWLMYTRPYNNNDWRQPQKWLQYEYPVPTYIASYAVNQNVRKHLFYNSVYKWKLYGDGKQIAKVNRDYQDIRANAWDQRQLYLKYPIKSPGYYKKYRFDDLTGAGFVEFSDIHFYAQPLLCEPERDCKYGLGKWGEWSECTDKCTKQRVFHSYDQSSGTCTGFFHEVPCNTGPCEKVYEQEWYFERDCVSEWGEWSTCEDGVRHRELNVTVEARGTGVACEASPQIERCSDDTEEPTNKCPEMFAPSGAKPHVCGNGVKEGDQCKFECDELTQKKAGDDSRTCGSDGKWTGSPLVCELFECDKIASPEGAISRKCEHKVAGDDCTFECQIGWVRDSGDSTRVCRNDGIRKNWDGEPLVCRQLVCDEWKAVKGSSSTTGCKGFTEDETCAPKCADESKTTGVSHTCTLGHWLPDVQNIVEPNWEVEQSSEDKYGGQAKYAIDGNYQSIYSYGIENSCTHTDGEDPDPGWWSLTFNDTYSIAAVRILNRIDCCEERLDGVTGFVMKEGADDVECPVQRYHTPAGEYATLVCPKGTHGTSLKILARPVVPPMKRSQLTMCEVEVLGVVGTDGTHPTECGQGPSIELVSLAERMGEPVDLYLIAKFNKDLDFENLIKLKESYCEIIIEKTNAEPGEVTCSIYDDANNDLMNAEHDKKEPKEDDEDGGIVAFVGEDKVVEYRIRATLRMTAEKKASVTVKEESFQSAVSAAFIKHEAVVQTGLSISEVTFEVTIPEAEDGDETGPAPGGSGAGDGRTSGAPRSRLVFVTMASILPFLF